MLSLFPQLLFLAPLGITLVRIVAALCFGYMAWYFWREQKEITGISVPIVGHMQTWMLMISETFMTLVAILLLVGAWVQVAALIGFVICAKQLVFYRRYRAIFPFERATYLLLAAISLMLVFTGAGAFAFDLPL